MSETNSKAESSSRLATIGNGAVGLYSVAVSYCKWLLPVVLATLYYENSSLRQEIKELKEQDRISAERIHRIGEHLKTQGDVPVYVLDVTKPTPTQEEQLKSEAAEQQQVNAQKKRISDLKEGFQKRAERQQCKPFNQLKPKFAEHAGLAFDIIQSLYQNPDDAYKLLSKLNLIGYNLSLINDNSLNIDVLVFNDNQHKNIQFSEEFAKTHPDILRNRLNELAKTNPANDFSWHIGGTQIAEFQTGAYLIVPDRLHTEGERPVVACR